jgi:hypothetical protein
MNKIMSIAIIGILILSGIGAVATNNEENQNKNLMNINSENIQFSEAVIDSSNDFIKVSLKDNTNYIMTPGEPMLPKVVKTFEVPFGSKNIDVKVTIGDIKERTINGEITPAPLHIPLISANQKISKNVLDIDKKDEKIYSSSEPYPNKWYNVRIGTGLNTEMEIVNHVSVHLNPMQYIPSKNKLLVADNSDIEITFEKPTNQKISSEEEFDLLIIAPKTFEDELGRLKTHKEELGLKTKIKIAEEIYEEYDKRDKPEEIKYCIKDAIENWNVKYLLLVGGLKNIFWAKPRDDNNYGESGWHIPVRYTNNHDNPAHPLLASNIKDPGVISDLYYADIYKYNETSGKNEFEDWDPTGDNLFAAWGLEGAKNDSEIDWYPDIAFGRLACRNAREVNAVVDKIIKYESGPCDPNWFKKGIAISGDGFLDQEILDFEWNTNLLPDGEYTINAQSGNPQGIYGPVDEIHVRIAKSELSSLNFNHDDHLRIDKYPSQPIVEITTPSNGDVLGKNNSYINPTENDAYCNEFSGWANAKYENGILEIRGKSYDPREYGAVTNVHVWIENSEHETVYDHWHNGTEMYYEGEWITGERLLEGKGGALYYLPEDFEKEIVWASKGNLEDQDDVLNALRPGCGFAFLSGHGSPNSWGDHFPGVPGNRRGGSFTGLKVIGIKPYGNFIDFPIFPMNTIKNTDKLPIVIIGGCHNSQFNVSMIPGLLDIRNKKNTWCHGAPVPECFSWYLVKMDRQGAIASIGNTGLGYGTLGKTCTIDGLDGGICIEFFKQYGDRYKEDGYDILGETYSRTLVQYCSEFDMFFQDHVKSLQQWQLLGDPSLRIGGYPN